ncbi:hypothetical protein QN372_15790 [Undibacterium sp. RTI2.1]|uniref:hypothetical protein n=1 Tax=unclassified Undibacterium TaxID=2630295 RepID=UPI002B224855|nr:MULTISPECIES: hypothetical protein [unclassified Undibacterium]MEB0032220.1 hypothetical protein [Undibacterium sp. RTI2.1]MEB0117034.1 hypothetical protein [Undibacterium sp. RTI2.2]
MSKLLKPGVLGILGSRGMVGSVGNWNGDNFLDRFCTIRLKGMIILLNPFGLAMRNSVVIVFN